MTPDALLPEQARSWPAEGDDREGDHEEHRRERDEDEARDEDVEDALERHLIGFVLDVEVVNVAVGGGPRVRRARSIEAKMLGREGEGYAEALADTDARLDGCPCRSELPAK